MDNLEVHGIQVQDQVRLGAGKANMVTHLTFYVGDHGPFFHDFPQGEGTNAAVQAFIQQRVADLRSIVQRQY